MHDTLFRLRTNACGRVSVGYVLRMNEDGQADVGGALGEGVHETDRALPSPARSRWLRKASRKVLVEMTSVCNGLVASTYLADDATSSAQPRC